MTRLEKIKLAIEKGYRYNEKTGIVTSPKGKELNRANNMGYIYLAPYKDGKTHMLLVHQFAWYCVYKETVECIDHINQVKTDNRIENLRSVSKLQNQNNQRERKGYTFYKRDNNWKAQISIRGIVTHIGYFKNEEDARNAYNERKEKYSKEILNQ
jgi:hypothetical protein